MNNEIINIEQYGDALRSTGYKNIESAVSEIIDNSIEAEAKDIFVIVTDTIPEYAGKRYVTEIAFLDNGFGMNIDTLSSCLQIGYGTRRERRGMGRFGVGLPQSSLHAAPRVEVYSWQNGIENCRMTFLDINMIRSGEQKVFPEPIQTVVPQKYYNYVNYLWENRQFDFSISGTLVVWKDCDNISPKTIKPLFDRLEFELGKKFRHLIAEGMQNIYLVHSQNEQLNRKVMPNDPLFLMKPNLVLGKLEAPDNIQERNNTDYTETLFEPYKTEDYPEGIMPVNVEYRDRATKEKRKSTVLLQFSVVRREFYDITAIPGNPGGTRMGQHVKRLEGISVVRAKREIDFGQFDFYSNLNLPEHRWWGCEISFMPELDEAFGVSNNKQHVELIKLDDSEYEDEDDVKPIWLQIRRQIGDTIIAMYKRNKDIRKSARTPETEVTPAEKIVNQVEEGSTADSVSKQEREKLSEEELREQARDFLTEHKGEVPTDEILDVCLANKVNIIYKSQGRRGHFFDYDFKGMGASTCFINTDHIFYENFVRNIEDNPDFMTAFELFLASLVITINEASLRDRDSFDELVTTWNEKLRKYISTQLKGVN